MNCTFGRCEACRTRVHYHPDCRRMPIALQPRQEPARHIPPLLHRKLVAGVVWPVGPPGVVTGGVWLEHTEVCPCRARPTDVTLGFLWDTLAFELRQRNDEAGPDEPDPVLPAYPTSSDYRIGP